MNKICIIRTLNSIQKEKKKKKKICFTFMRSILDVKMSGMIRDRWWDIYERYIYLDFCLS